jgi:hypothetical protein
MLRAAGRGLKRRRSGAVPVDLLRREALLELRMGRVRSSTGRRGSGSTRCSDGRCGGQCRQPAAYQGGGGSLRDAFAAAKKVQAEADAARQRLRFLDPVPRDVPELLRADPDANGSGHEQNGLKQEHPTGYRAVVC